MSEKNPYFGSTFAERKAIREGRESKPTERAEAKQIDAEADEVEDKAVKPSRKRTSTKKV